MDITIIAIAGTDGAAMTNGVTSGDIMARVIATMIIAITATTATGITIAGAIAAIIAAITIGTIDASAAGRPEQPSGGAVHVT
jgi:hypothetical protein